MRDSRSRFGRRSEGTPSAAEIETAGEVDDPEKTADEMFDEFEEDDDPETAEKPRKDKSWFKLLDVTEKGEVKATLHNVTTILASDPRVCDSIVFNIHTQTITLRRPTKLDKLGVRTLPVPTDGYGRAWQDADDIATRNFLSKPKRLQGWDLKAAQQDVTQGVLAAAMERPWHPIREYLGACEWDGVKRVETFWSDVLGCEDNAYTREAALAWFVAGVTRVFEPGCKFDCIPILGGAQGKRKSTLISIIGKRRWAGLLASDFDNLGRMIESMQGFWILEIGELKGFARNEITTVKAFVSSPEDKYRLAYAHRPGNYPRQCIFIGSTNDEQYLRDPSGNRRFWPLQVAVNKIDTNAVEAVIGVGRGAAPLPGDAEEAAEGRPLPRPPLGRGYRDRGRRA